MALTDGLLTREWFSPRELAEAALPGLPATERRVTAMAHRLGWRERMTLGGQPAARERQARGGGWEYHYTLLPVDAVRAVVQRYGAAGAAGSDAPAEGERAAIWAAFERLPSRHQTTARERLAILDEVDALIAGGWGAHTAVRDVADRRGVACSTVFAWRRLVEGCARGDRLPALAPAYRGGGKAAEMPREAWDVIVSDYLRPERPSFEACYRRLQDIAAEQGWTIPAARTLRRRIEREVDPNARILARQGREALKQALPAQRRSVADLAALQCIVMDGHRHDNLVIWPDGTVGRPMSVFVSDLYSRRLLAWRTDRSESAALVRLALGDLVDHWGVPDMVCLDNGRGFASKWITGGTANRYRFKVRPEDPEGILTALGVEVRWTEPYNGRAKPIERSFRDLADDLATAPDLAGSWTGRSPVDKPEDRGARPVPIAEFLRVRDREVARWNARLGRQTETARGSSFDAVFRASYEAQPIRRVSPAQRRLWLLAADQVAARARDGIIHWAGNRYYAEELARWRGRKLTIRFDPDALHAGVHVYRPDGGYLVEAACIADSGFFNHDDAVEHKRLLKGRQKTARAALDAERRLEAHEIAALMPRGAETPEAGDPAVVRPIFKTPPSRDPDAGADLPAAGDAEVVDFDSLYAAGIHRMAKRNEGGAA